MVDERQRAGAKGHRGRATSSTGVACAVVRRAKISKGQVLEELIPEGNTFDKEYTSRSWNTAHLL